MVKQSRFVSDYSPAEGDDSVALKLIQTDDGDIIIDIRHHPDNCNDTVRIATSGSRMHGEKAVRITQLFSQLIDEFNNPGVVLAEPHQFTREELQQMGGKPIWHHSLAGNESKWRILEPAVAARPQDYYYEDTWVAYDREFSEA